MCLTASLSQGTRADSSASYKGPRLPTIAIVNIEPSTRGDKIDYYRRWSMFTVTPRALQGLTAEPAIRTGQLAEPVVDSWGLPGGKPTAAHHHRDLPSEGSVVEPNGRTADLAPLLTARSSFAAGRPRAETSSQGQGGDRLVT